MKVQISPPKNTGFDCPVGVQFNSLPLEKDHFLARGNKELAWKKYCGFLEFTIDEFNSIQKLLLKEQIEISMRTARGREILGDRIPESPDEFRRFTPLTGYSDYPVSSISKSPSELVAGWQPRAEGPHCDSESGTVLFNHNNARALVDDAITALILSSATFKGDVKLEPLDRMLISLKAKSVSQAINQGLSQRLECESLIDPVQEPIPESFCSLDRGIEKGLKRGIDFIISTSESIAGLGESMDYATIRSHFSGLNLPITFRLIKAWSVGQISGRPCLAKDIWQVKGLICCDTGSAECSRRIENAWGIRPLSVYYAPEGGFMALQSWNKKGLTFIPYRNLYEFIPLPELEKEAADQSYVPATVAMNEVKPDNIYELVVTNFRGGPFLRYRIGDYLRVTALKDEEAGINLPQFRLCEKAELEGSLLN